jgi:SET family sugar efflux transporter-like MFS transporter
MPGDVNGTPGRSVLFDPAFIGLLGTNFMLGLTSTFVLPFGSLWATGEIGMSARFLGLFMTCNAIGAVFISTLIARWSDTHTSRLTLLLIGASAGALGNLCYAFVTDPLWLLAIGSTVLGVASINFAQFFAHVREELARKESAQAHVPFAMGVLRACFSLAWVVGPNLGAWIKGRYGYRGIFFSTTGSFIAFALMVVLFVRRRPRASPAQTGARVGWGFGQPILIGHCVAFALLFAALTINSLNLPLFLTQALGGSDQSLGMAFAISPLFEMLFMLWFGHLATKGYQVSVIRIGIVAAVCYFSLLRGVTAPWQVYPLQVLNAAAVAVTTSVIIPFIQDLLPRQAGAATSLYSNSLKVGSFIGFSTFGILASSVGNGGLFLVCAGLGTATLLIVWLARPRAV